jgi:hypothetical protein
MKVRIADLEQQIHHLRNLSPEDQRARELIRDAARLIEEGRYLDKERIAQLERERDEARAERAQWEDRTFRAAEEGREQFDEGAEAMRNEIAAHLKAWEVAAGDKFLLTWQGVRNEIYTAPTPLPPEAQQGGNSSH